ncbi:phosphatase PAP2 family protein [Streptomyces sp. KS 21]|uniref:phosphatase PAP2 family protein n=1 Tax=Streptomyces sp. KS 21 TaxID=2485150 RepID=UPI001063B236|nr:phosphatase PAP2 family protein [Streptomyces sp. KS 21]TDU80102.1 undecaprenyl-diphosphatase [Streptomyces sp. KS 21]
MKTGQAPSPTRWALASVLCAALFALLTALVVARHGTPFALDESWHRWSVQHRSSFPVALARGVTATGSGPLPYACAVAAGIIAGRGSRGRVMTAAGALGFLVLVQAVRHAVLYGVARPRPPVADWAALAAWSAFPSGHATTSVIVAGLLAWAAWRTATPATARFCWVLAACWAVSVGLSRIYLGVHWPTDVLGGWLYALTWLTAAKALAAANRM